MVNLCRRICHLRFFAHLAEADSLQMNELPRLLALLPTAPDVDARLHDVFASEEKRMADARALAELLAPLLAEQLRSVFVSLPASSLQAPASAPQPSSSPFATPALSPAAASATSAPKPAARPVRTTVPGIADFIDDMLAQERPARRAS